ncbi:MAG: hypothetical protein P3X22_002695 [Thermoprotei archaeon]|nr:hypothetical protein [Thermoprotei archaeon]
MQTRELLGLIITVIALLIMAYATLYVGFSVRKIEAMNAWLYSIAWLLLLVGPWLWIGTVPGALKRFVEARTGRKLG